MAKEYLVQLNGLIARLTSSRLKGINLECKHFFSGAAVYANGNIFMSWTPVGLAIKLPETLRASLIKQYRAKHLRYFPNGPIKKDYVLLPPSMLKATRILTRLVKNSVDYVLSLPIQKKKNSSPTLQAHAKRRRRI